MHYTVETELPSAARELQSAVRRNAAAGSGYDDMATVELFSKFGGLDACHRAGGIQYDHGSHSLFDKYVGTCRRTMIHRVGKLAGLEADHVAVFGLVRQFSDRRRTRSMGGGWGVFRRLVMMRSLSNRLARYRGERSPVQRG